MIEPDRIYRNSDNQKIAPGAQWLTAMRHGDCEMDEDHLWYDGENGSLKEIRKKVYNDNKH